MNKYEEEEALYVAAKKRVKKKKGFYNHLGAFLAVGFFFLAMNLLTSPHETWWPFPMLPWSIGLIIHYLSVFGFPFSGGVLSEEWEIRETSKEMRRLSGDDAPDMEDDDYLDLKEIKREKEKEKRSWNDGDLV